jgi:hypothetical protein
MSKKRGRKGSALRKSNDETKLNKLVDSKEPTEIEVEIEMQDIRLPHGANESYIKSKPKLDSNGCLILRKL